MPALPGVFCGCIICAQRMLLVHRKPSAPIACAHSANPSFGARPAPGFQLCLPIFSPTGDWDVHAEMQRSTTLANAVCERFFAFLCQKPSNLNGACTSSSHVFAAKAPIWLYLMLQQKKQEETRGKYNTSYPRKFTWLVKTTTSQTNRERMKNRRYNRRRPCMYTTNKPTTICIIHNIPN